MSIFKKKPKKPEAGPPHPPTDAGAGPPPPPPPPKRKRSLLGKKGPKPPKMQPQQPKSDKKPKLKPRLEPQAPPVQPTAGPPPAVTPPGPTAPPASVAAPGAVPGTQPPVQPAATGAPLAPGTPATPAAPGPPPKKKGLFGRRKEKAPKAPKAEKPKLKSGKPKVQAAPKPPKGQKKSLFSRKKKTPPPMPPTPGIQAGGVPPVAPGTTGMPAAGAPVQPQAAPLPGGPSLPTGPPAKKKLFGKKPPAQPGAPPAIKPLKPAKQKKKKAKSGGVGGSKTSAIGLDLGRTSISAVRLKHQTGGSALLSVALDNLPEGLVQEGEVRDVEGLSYAIKEFWKIHKIKGKRVSLGLANQKVIVRTLEFPLLDPKELRSAIEFQAQDYIPIPIDEAVFDFHVLEQFTDEDGMQKQKVLVVAAQKFMVMDFINAIKKAKLQVDSIDLQAFAMLRSLGGKSFLEENQPVKEAVAIANIASDVTNIVVATDGEPQFTRIVSFGGDNFTKALQDLQGIPFPEAELLKAQVGLPLPGTPQQAAEEAAGAVTTPGEGPPAGEGPGAEPSEADTMHGGEIPPELPESTFFSSIGQEPPAGPAAGPEGEITGGPAGQQPGPGEAPAAGPGEAQPEGAGAGGPPEPMTQGGQAGEGPLSEQAGPPPVMPPAPEGRPPEAQQPPAQGWPAGPSPEAESPEDTMTNMQRALETTAEALADEIRRSLDYYMSQELSAPISKLILSGGGAMLTNLDLHLAQVFTFPVELGNPLRRITQNRSDLSDDELRALAPRLAIAIGLSLEDEG